MIRFHLSVRQLSLSAVGAALLLCAGAVPSQAQALSSASRGPNGSAVPDGLAAMVRVRVPFGEEVSRKGRRQRSHATIALTAGVSWRDQTGSPDFTGPRYVSTAEAGFTEEGEAVLKVGPVDLIKRDDDSR
jgi:hypothetical protein